MFKMGIDAILICLIDTHESTNELECIDNCFKLLSALEVKLGRQKLKYPISLSAAVALCKGMLDNKEK